MKKTLSILLLVCVAALGNALGISKANADTNDIQMAGCYERLTKAIVRNFGEDIQYTLKVETKDRDLKAKMWVRLLNQIAETRDGHFDFQAPENRYYANVAPPLKPSSQGVIYDSGIAPELIKEPDIRYEYEKTIMQNHLKAVRFQFEKKMKNLDESAVAGAAQFFMGAFNRTPDDEEKLKNYLNEILDHEQVFKLKGKLSEFSFQKGG